MIAMKKSVLIFGLVLFPSSLFAGQADVLVVHETKPLVYFGWYRASMLSPTGWDVFDSSLDWMNGDKEPVETDVVLFTYNGSLDPGEYWETSSIFFYDHLIDRGFSVKEVRSQLDMDLLKPAFYDNFDIAIYSHRYPRDISNILSAGIPFLTVSSGQTMELGVGSGEFFTNGISSEFFVVNNQHPTTSSYPIGGLTFENDIFYYPIRAAGSGIPLVSAVPEPTALALFGAGAMLLLARRRRKRNG